MGSRGGAGRDAGGGGRGVEEMVEKGWWARRWQVIKMERGGGVRGEHEVGGIWPFNQKTTFRNVLINSELYDYSVGSLCT